MLQNTIIFVIILYLIVTNTLCKLHIDKSGVYLVLKKRDFISSPTGLTEREHVKVKTIFKFGKVNSL